MRITGEQIRVRGLTALRRELGRAGLVRFFQHFTNGEGDYSRQREELLKAITISDLRKLAAGRKKR